MPCCMKGLDSLAMAKLITQVCAPPGMPQNNARCTARCLSSPHHFVSLPRQRRDRGIGMRVRFRAASGEQGTPSLDSDATGKAADDNNEAGGIVKAAKGFFASMSAQNEENACIHHQKLQLGMLLRFMTFTRQLKRFGIAGVLSYGLFNTVYYLGTFLFVWFYVSPSPGRLGYAAAAQRFMKVLAMVWAGSQVTKLFRAAGALALAPLVDRGLSWFTNKFHFHSREKAFGFVVGACFGLAVVVFLVITTLWA